MNQLRYIAWKIYHVAVIHSFALVCSWWPVWFHIANREGKKYYQRYRIPLAPAEHRVAADLTAHGIAVTHLNELFPHEGAALLSALQANAAEALQRDEEGMESNKSFLKFLWSVTPTIDADNPFIQLSVREPITNIINTYMGMYTKFNYFTLNVTTPVAESAKPVQSQKWHRDPEDKKLCKIFLYLNDIDEDRGPFTYIKGSHYGGKWRRVFMRRPPHGCRPPPGGVERRIPPDQMRVCTGSAGTLIFCDTSGLHRGGYARSSTRLMFTGVFTSRASFKPIGYRCADGFHARVRMFESPAARYALDQTSPRPVRAWFERLLRPEKWLAPPAEHKKIVEEINAYH